MTNFKANHLYFSNIKNMKFEIKGWSDVSLLSVLFRLPRKSCTLHCKVAKGGGRKSAMPASLSYLILRKNIVKTRVAKIEAPFCCEIGYFSFMILKKIL